MELVMVFAEHQTSGGRRNNVSSVIIAVVVLNASQDVNIIPMVLLAMILSYQDAQIRSLFVKGVFALNNLVQHF